MNFLRKISALRHSDRIMQDQRHTINDLYDQRTKFLHKNFKLIKALNFALDNIVYETAGNEQNPFAYFWTKDWMEFKKMAHEALKENHVSFIKKET